MKINVDKIKKYQVGGSIVYQPIPVPQFQPMGVMPSPGQPDAATVAGQDVGTGPLDKEIIKELLGKGLTNDVMAFSSMVNNAYAQYQSLSELEKNSILGQRLRNAMKGDLGQLNNLRRNKDLLTGAITKVESNDAGSDYAVTERGMIIKDLETGKIAEVTAEQFAAEGSDRFKILTNAELIGEREYNPNLVNDAKSIQALNSAVGMNGVREEIRAILTNLGEVSSSSSDQKYIFKGGAINGKEMAAAVQQLVGQGMDGFYKAGSSNSSSSNAKNIEIAAEAMWVNMSANTKSLLKARAAAKGVAPDQLENAAKEYAVALLKPAVKDSQDSKRTIDYDAAMTDDLKKATQPQGDDEKYLGSIGEWQNLLGMGGDPQSIKINAGGNTDMTAIGFKQRGFAEDGKPIAHNSMIRDIPTLMRVGDLESYSIGGMKVRRDQLDAVMYEGGEVATVEMPYVQDGNSIIPDLRLNEKYSAAVKEIESMGGKNLPATMRSQIFKKYGINTNSDGKPALKLANFITFTGKINENAFDKGKKLDQTFLRKVGQNEENEYKDKFTRDKDGKKIEKADFGKYWFVDSDVYRGQVFIHYTDGYKSDRFLDGNDLAVPKYVTSANYLSTPNENQRKLNEQNDTRNASKYQLP